MPSPPVVDAPRVALAEPELDLWMEGTKPIDPAESTLALQRSRSALSQALEGRGLHDPEPEQIMTVRVGAVARTQERKNAQVASWIGVGVLVVAVIAVVVLVVLWTKPGSGAGKKGAGAGSAGGRAFAPAPPRGGGFGAPYAPPLVGPYPPPPPFGVDLGLLVVVPSEEPALADTAPAPVDPLSSRTWFQGDAVELTVELTDAATRETIWHRTVSDGIDPRDAAAMSRLVDRALEGLPFGQKGRNPVESPAVTD